MFGFLLCVWCVCIAGVAFAEEETQVSGIDELEEYKELDSAEINMMRQAARLTLAQQGDTSPEIFEDIEYLQGVLRRLNWENSQDQTRKGLYNKLSQAVESIKSLEAQELKEKYQIAQDAKEIEKSFENRMLGAAAIGTIGLGAMELASAMSEKKAMEEAEQQMKAYLATFSCTYDDGKRFSGGETAIELPGGNELLSLVGEYKTLAADLKLRKEALGLKPGIESEEILDKANSGLYDDVATGKTDGAFTSLSRALSDENSEDAAEWAADKEAINQKVKTATTALAVAAATSIAANLAINGVRERRNQLAEKAKPVTDDVYAVLSEIVDMCNDERIRSGKSYVISWTQLLGEDENICNVQ